MTTPDEHPLEHTVRGIAEATDSLATTTGALVGSTDSVAAQVGELNDTVRDLVSSNRAADRPHPLVGFLRQFDEEQVRVFLERPPALIPPPGPRWAFTYYPESGVHGGEVVGFLPVRDDGSDVRAEPVFEQDDGSFVSHGWNSDRSRVVVERGELSFDMVRKATRRLLTDRLSALVSSSAVSSVVFVDAEGVAHPPSYVVEDRLGIDGGEWGLGDVVEEDADRAERFVEDVENVRMMLHDVARSSPGDTAGWPPLSASLREALAAQPRDPHRRSATL
jgi:hypothetical protein